MRCIRATPNPSPSPSALTLTLTYAHGLTLPLALLTRTLLTLALLTLLTLTLDQVRQRAARPRGDRRLRALPPLHHRRGILPLAALHRPGEPQPYP